MKYIKPIELTLENFKDYGYVEGTRTLNLRIDSPIKEFYKCLLIKN
jgi:hypothetical protein